MKKVIVQVHYCGSEESLNGFLSILKIEGDSYPKLYNITFIPKPEGNGNNDSMQINGSVIAAVQYLIEVEEKDDKN